MRIALAALVLVAAPIASAQTIVLQLDGQSEDVVRGQNSCADTLTVTWTVAPTDYCSSLDLWATQNTCGELPGTDDLTLDSVSEATVEANGTGTASFVIADLPIFTAACPEAGLEDTVTLCASVEYSTATFGLPCSTKSVASATDEPRVTYDARAPARPTITAVTALDSALGLEVTVPDDADVIFVDYRVAGATAFERGGPFTTTSVRLEGLQNGQAYDVRAIVVDLAGNESEASELAEGTPVLTLGFYGRYRGAGGSETGGCSAAGGDAALLGGALAMVLAFWRRRRS